MPGQHPNITLDPAVWREWETPSSFRTEGPPRAQMASETTPCALTAERNPSQKKGRRDRRLRKDRKMDRKLDVRPRPPQA